MAGHSTAAVAHAGSNPFLRVVAAISTVAGWCAAAMIVVAVVVTCQMIFVRLVLNASTVWQTETVIYLVIAATLVGLPYVQRLRGTSMSTCFPCRWHHVPASCWPASRCRSRSWSWR